MKSESVTSKHRFIPTNAILSVNITPNSSLRLDLKKSIMNNLKNLLSKKACNTNQTQKEQKEVIPLFYIHYLIFV